MDRETKVILIIYSALLLLISSPLLFFGHVKQNPDDFYEYNYTKIKYYTKYKNSSKIPEIQYHCLLAAIPKPVPRYMALFPMEA